MTRRPARVIALLLSASSVAAGCGGDSEPIFVDDVVERVPTTIVIVPATTSAPPENPDPIVVTRAWSPARSIAEIIGTGALANDVVSLDGAVVSADSFVLDASGGFTVRVRTEGEGAHNVCVRDVCSRVFTTA